MQTTITNKKSYSLAVWLNDILVLLALLLFFSTTVQAEQLTIDQAVNIPAEFTQYKKDDVIPEGATVTIGGNHSYNRLQLVNDSVLSYSLETTSISNLLVATIDTSYSIDVSAKCQLPRAETCSSCELITAVVNKRDMQKEVNKTT